MAAKGFRKWPGFRGRDRHFVRRQPYNLHEMSSQRLGQHGTMAPSRYHGPKLQLCVQVVRCALDAALGHRWKVVLQVFHHAAEPRLSVTTEQMVHHVQDSELMLERLFDIAGEWVRTIRKKRNAMPLQLWIALLKELRNRHDAVFLRC